MFKTSALHESRLCSAALGGSCKVKNRRFDGSKLFVVSQLEPNCSQKHLLPEIALALKHSRADDIMFLAREIDARIELLFPIEDS